MRRKDKDRPARAGEHAVVDSGRSDSLESFINRLHAEGVEAGRQEADKVLQAAEAQAAQIIAAAESTSRRLVADAEKKAAALVAEGRTELALAARDAQLELREKLSQALTALLRGALEHELGDPVLVRELLREIVQAYARADSSAPGTIEVRVRPEMVDELAGAVPGMLGRALAGQADGLQLKATLSAAGFEYHSHHSVLEVTADSVAEKLAAMVTPRLRALLREAAGESALVSA